MIFLVIYVYLLDQVTAEINNSILKSIRQHMTRLISKKSAKLALDWCISKYGPSRFADLDSLQIRLDSKMEDFGVYDEIDNIIFLNPKRHTTLKEWVETVIHEYVHFKQPIYEKYSKYFEEYGRNYNNHPYEITAYNKADRDSAEARAWVLKEIRQLNKARRKL
jgi:hypothetical protein